MQCWGAVGKSLNWVDLNVNTTSMPDKDLADDTGMARLEHGNSSDQ